MAPATEVGDLFAKQYYLLLQDYPEELHRLYKDSSKIGRPGKDGDMCYYTLSDVDENLNMLSSGGFKSAELTSVVSQDSINGGVLVNVGGYFALNERPIRHFTQDFFLAPHEKGYFVLNDTFTFHDNPIPPPAANNVAEEEASETEVTREEVADGSPTVSEPDDGLEDGSKIADASVVTKPIPKGEGQHSSSDPSPARPPAKEVGDAFVKQYYLLLEDHPTELCRVYKDFSKIGRPGKDGRMCTCTLSDIDENLNMISSGGYNSVVVTSVDSQDSINGGVLVNVGGYFALNERLIRNFTQNFFLVPQEKGYFVLNDTFIFHDNPIPPANDNVIVEKVPDTEVAREEVADGSPRVSEPNDGLEDSSKIVDASVVMKAIPKGQGQHSSSYPSPEIKADAVDDTENRNNQESLAFTECSVIHVKNLPANYTIASIENAFKKFGAIKRGGTEVRTYYYGTVKFEEAKAAERAVKASPVTICGRKVHVEKKRGAYRSYLEHRRRRVHEEEGRQHNQSRYRSEQVRGTTVVDVIWFQEEERGTGNFWDWQRSMERESKLRKEAGVDNSWDYEVVMEEHRKFLEEKEEENQN